MKRVNVLLAICSFTIALVVPASASPCSSTQYDMMSWFEMGSSWSTEYHLTNNNNPLYTYRGNPFYWEKGLHYPGPVGYPWDVNYYDNNYIYQWATEYNWNDPTSYKAFDNPIPWSPRCVNKPAAGVYGSKLATITLASTPYTIYESNCAASSKMNLGYVVNEIWGPTPMSLGGSLPNNTLTLTLSYRYDCDSSFDNCHYKETFDFQRPFGLVQWTYYKWLNGQYVQQNYTRYNHLASGGAPPPDHPCW
jgi:hypothetical protein